MLRFDGGARGMLWASGVAAGLLHGHRIRVFGEKAGLEWLQSRPDELHFLPRGGRPCVIQRDVPGLSAASRRGRGSVPAMPVAISRLGRISIPTSPMSSQRAS